MAEPANRPEFSGNVVNVLTEKYWDSQLSKILLRRETLKKKVAQQNREQKLTQEAAKQLETQLLTEAISIRENELLNKGV